MGKRIIIILISALLVSGCAKLTHLQELLTIKAYSDNQEAQAQYIKETDARFEKLLAAVSENRMDEYPTKTSIRRAFGWPILSRDITRNGEPQQQWLYRYAVRPFDSEKIYIYFDEAGAVMDIEYVPAPEAPESS